jgi:hypothetical protein
LCVRSVLFSLQPGIEYPHGWKEANSFGMFCSASGGSNASEIYLLRSVQWRLAAARYSQPGMCRGMPSEHSYDFMECFRFPCAEKCSLLGVSQFTMVFLSALCTSSRILCASQTNIIVSYGVILFRDFLDFVRGTLSMAGLAVYPFARSQYDNTTSVIIPRFPERDLKFFVVCSIYVFGIEFLCSMHTRFWTYHFVPWRSWGRAIIRSILQRRWWNIAPTQLNNKKWQDKLEN